MTKDEMIAAIKECAAKLGHVPSLTEVRNATKVTHRGMRRNFGTYTRALNACGLERQGAGYQLSMKSLFTEWAEMVRRLGKVPTLVDYEEHSRYSVRPLLTRFKSWKHVPFGLQQYVKREGLEAEWQDVLDVIERHQEWRLEKKRTSRPPTRPDGKSGLLTDRPTYGTPLLSSPLTFAPINEIGVVFLFGAVAERLGFAVTRLQTEFPDCEALREVERERWQPVRIEFEYESRNFRAHMHPAEDCDLIVCWSHNWADCPLEVLELKSVLGREKLTADLH